MGVALTGGTGSLQTGVREARKEASVTLEKNGTSQLRLPTALRVKTGAMTVTC